MESFEGLESPVCQARCRREKPVRPQRRARNRRGFEFEVGHEKPSAISNIHVWRGVSEDIEHTEQRAGVISSLQYTHVRISQLLARMPTGFSTSCVRTICPKLLTILEQLVDYL